MRRQGPNINSNAAIIVRIMGLPEFCDALFTHVVDIFGKDPQYKKLQESNGINVSKMGATSHSRRPPTRIICDKDT